MIRLRTRMVLTYAACLFAAVMVLSLVTNQVVENLFARFVQQNIEEKNEEIVESVGRQFDPLTGEFNPVALMALGMEYANQGFIISIEKPGGEILWDARQCDMQFCSDRMQEIVERMAEHKVNGEAQITRHPLMVEGNQLGYINIESIGPFFYNEAESDFITSLNNLLLLSTGVFFMLTVGISILLAATITKPVRSASQTARKIADGDFFVRMETGHRTVELQELSLAVNDLAAALENAQSWQKRLTSNIAHELRTPLTTLQCTLEAMLDGVWEPDANHLASCHEEIVRLSNLVADLNDVSILEQENLLLQKTEFDVSRLCQEVVTQLSPVLLGKEVALVYHPASIMVTADYHRLKQVLLNIVSNAIRYTNKGTIELEAKTDGEFLVLAVADTGKGIAPQDVAHIFDRFYRADKSRNRETGGAGIGLTIAKSIAEAHGGDIQVKSKEGTGTVFYITIPLHG